MGKKFNYKFKVGDRVLYEGDKATVVQLRTAGTGELEHPYYDVMKDKEKGKIQYPANEKELTPIKESKLRQLIEAANRKCEMAWKVYSYNPEKDNELVDTSKAFDCIAAAQAHKRDILEKNPNYTVEIVAESSQKNESVEEQQDAIAKKIADALSAKFGWVLSKEGPYEEYYIGKGSNPINVKIKNDKDLQVQLRANEQPKTFKSTKDAIDFIKNNMNAYGFPGGSAFYGKLQSKANKNIERQKARDTYLHDISDSCQKNEGTRQWHKLSDITKDDKPFIVIGKKDSSNNYYINVVSSLYDLTNFSNGIWFDLDDKAFNTKEQAYDRAKSSYPKAKVIFANQKDFSNTRLKKYAHESAQKNEDYKNPKNYDELKPGEWYKFKGDLVQIADRQPIDNEIQYFPVFPDLHVGNSVHAAYKSFFKPTDFVYADKREHINKAIKERESQIAKLKAEIESLKKSM